MKNRKVSKILISVLFVIAIVMVCACSKEKETDKASGEVTSNMADSSVQVSESEESGTPTEDSSGSESESDQVTEDTSKEEKQPTFEVKSGEEMEKNFLDACEKMGIKVQKREYDGKYDYFAMEPDYKGAFMVCPDEVTAQKEHQEVLDYGGWYEEDKVVREIKESKDGFEFIAYYCENKETKETLIFVEAYSQNITFEFEAWNTEKVHMIEDLLSELGVIL